MGRSTQKPAQNPTNATRTLSQNHGNGDVRRSMFGAFWASISGLPARTNPGRRFRSQASWVSPRLLVGGCRRRGRARSAAVRGNTRLTAARPQPAKRRARHVRGCVAGFSGRSFRVCPPGPIGGPRGPIGRRLEASARGRATLAPGQRPPGSARGRCSCLRRHGGPTGRGSEGRWGPRSWRRPAEPNGRTHSFRFAGNLDLIVIV